MINGANMNAPLSSNLERIPVFFITICRKLEWQNPKALTSGEPRVDRDRFKSTPIYVDHACSTSINTNIWYHLIWLKFYHAQIYLFIMFFTSMNALSRWRFKAQFEPKISKMFIQKVGSGLPLLSHAQKSVHVPLLRYKKTWKLVKLPMNKRWPRGSLSKWRGLEYMRYIPNWQVCKHSTLTYICGVIWSCSRSDECYHFNPLW